MSATYDDVLSAISALSSKLDTMISSSSNVSQQQIQALTQERQTITQLQMEGFTKAEAIAYYQRMLKGEKPWLDPEPMPST
jgi:ElaB/YqjD/DUF883 family membrane-anchored ribosome-binding protein